MQKIVGAFLVGLVALYVADAAFCNGVYFNAAQQMFTHILNRY